MLGSFTDRSALRPNRIASKKQTAIQELLRNMKGGFLRSNTGEKFQALLTQQLGCNVITIKAHCLPSQVADVLGVAD